MSGWSGSKGLNLECSFPTALHHRVMAKKEHPAPERATRQNIALFLNHNLSSTLLRPICPPAPAYSVSAYPNCSSGNAYPSPPLPLDSLNADGLGFVSHIPASTSPSSSCTPPLDLPPCNAKLWNRPFCVLLRSTCTSNPTAASVATNPSSAKLNKALYVRHTLCPNSDSQFSTAHADARVAELHHASRLKESVHSIARPPLRVRFSVGFRPWRMCRMIVAASARMVRRETARSWVC